MKMQYLKIARWAILIICTLGLFSFIIKNRSEFHFILNIRLNYLFIILILILVSLSLTCYRYFLTIKAASGQIGFWRCYKYFTIGRFLNKIIPHSGGAFRAIIFKKKDNFSYNKYISSFLSFTWIDIVFSLLFGIILISAYSPTLNIRNINVLGIFIILLILSILIIPLFGILYRLPHFSNVIKNRYQKGYLHIKKAADTILLVIKNRSFVLNSGIITLLTIFLNINLIHLCFRSINIETHIPTLVVFVVLAKLGAIFKITPGNFGIREFIYGFLSGSMGIGIAEGISVSMILRISNFVVQGVLSLIFILRD